MRAWNMEIFDDDTASDIRADFESLFVEGSSVEQVTDVILRDYASSLDDVDERAVVYLSLAALQVEHQSVQPDIRAEALRIIDSDEDIERIQRLQEGRERDAADLDERRVILADLRARLIATEI